MNKINCLTCSTTVACFSDGAVDFHLYAPSGLSKLSAGFPCLNCN